MTSPIKGITIGDMLKEQAEAKQTAEEAEAKRPENLTNRVVNTCPTCKRSREAINGVRTFFTMLVARATFDTCEECNTIN